MSETNKNFKEISFNSSDLFSLIDLLDSKESFKLYIFLMSKTKFGKFLDNLDDLTNSKIASIIGIKRQNVSRAIEKLEKELFVFRENKKITKVLTPNEIRQYNLDKKKFNKDVKDVAQFATDIELAQFKDLISEESFKKASEVCEVLFADFENCEAGNCAISNYIKKYKKRTTRRNLFKTIVALIAIFGADRVYKKFYELHEYSKSFINEIKDSLINNEKIFQTKKILKVVSICSSLTELEKNNLKLFHSLSLHELDFIKEVGIREINLIGEAELEIFITNFKQRSLRSENGTTVH
ncbi:hypothetical protein ABMA75_03205 [Halobacteriovorax sp. ZH4_bin.1]|uniref:hypothetical protein n=1 Tax=unclassified Halobacteriovorax TaxID=2639665 RepID=UPI003722B12D